MEESEEADEDQEPVDYYDHEPAEVSAESEASLQSEEDDEPDPDGDEGAPPYQEDEGAGNDGQVGEDTDVPNEEQQALPSRPGLRSQRGRNYDPIYRPDWETGATLTQLSELLESENIQGVFHNIVGYMMTQMTATAGIQKHGDTAIKALFKELAQLNKKMFSLLWTLVLCHRNKKGSPTCNQSHQGEAERATERTNVCGWQSTKIFVLERRNSITNPIKQRADVVFDD